MTKRSNKKQIQRSKPTTPTSRKQVQIQEQYQGPIPPPNFLDAYEKIHPGLADRIVQMAEKEQGHRQEMEQNDLAAAVGITEKELTEARIGQIFALIIGLAVIVAGAYCATNGAPWPGAIIGSSGVVGLVSAFIIGRKTNPRNNQPKGK